MWILLTTLVLRMKCQQGSEMSDSAPERDSASRSLGSLKFRAGVSFLQLWAAHLALEDRAVEAVVEVDVPRPVDVCDQHRILYASCSTRLRFSRLSFTVLELS